MREKKQQKKDWFHILWFLRKLQNVSYVDFNCENFGKAKLKIIFNIKKYICLKILFSNKLQIKNMPKINKLKYLKLSKLL